MSKQEMRIVVNFRPYNVSRKTASVVGIGIGQFLTKQELASVRRDELCFCNGSGNVVYPETRISDGMWVSSLIAKSRPVLRIFQRMCEDLFGTNFYAIIPEDGISLIKLLVLGLSPISVRRSLDRITIEEEEAQIRISLFHKLGKVIILTDIRKMAWVMEFHQCLVNANLHLISFPDSVRAWWYEKRPDIDSELRRELEGEIRMLRDYAEPFLLLVSGKQTFTLENLRFVAKILLHNFSRLFDSPIVLAKDAEKFLFGLKFKSLEQLERILINAALTTTSPEWTKKDIIAVVERVAPSLR